MHAQHVLLPNEQTAIADFRMAQFDDLAQRLLRHDLVHGCQKHIMLSYAAVALESSIIPRLAINIFEVRLETCNGHICIKQALKLIS